MVSSGWDPPLSKPIEDPTCPILMYLHPIKNTPFTPLLPDEFPWNISARGGSPLPVRLTYDLAKGGWPIFASWAGPLRSGASWKVWWHPGFYGIPHKELDKLLANLDKIYIFHGEKLMINHGSVKQVYGRFWKWTPSIIQVISGFLSRDTNGDKGHLNLRNTHI